MSQFDRRKELGEGARAAIDLARADIIAACTEIFNNPEAPQQEERASKWIADVLERYGFDVDHGVAGMPTAFHAIARNWNKEDMRKGLRHGHVAFLLSYDADPELGHVWGNHLAAGAALAAGLGLAATFAGMYGTVSVFGAPGPAVGGGKLRLAEAGLFEDADVIIGGRPRSTGQGFQPTINKTGETLAERSLEVDYADGPEDALAKLQQAVAELLDNLDEYETIEATDTGFIVRAPQSPTVEALAEQIQALANARAESSGVPVELTASPLTREFQVSRIMARRIKTFGDTIGLRQDRIVKGTPGLPSDWGNVSFVAATVEAGFPITTEPVLAGTTEFRDLGTTEEAFDQMILAAQSMALAGLDVLGDMEFRGFAEGEFIRGLKERGIQREPRRWLGVHPVQPPEDGKSTTWGRDLPDVIVRGPGLPPPDVTNS